MTVRIPRPSVIHKREITGAASLVVPSDELGDPDWDGFAAHLDRVAKVGLTPAINMTAAVPSLLVTNLQVGTAYQAQQALGDDFFAGIHIDDKPGDWFNVDRYRRQIDVITGLGGTPVIFPSHGLSALDDEGWLKAMNEISRDVDAFMIAELSAATSTIPGLRPLDAHLGLLRNSACRGIFHSTLSRIAEFARLHSQGTMRRDFMIYSGNERAIDMPMYGASYLLASAAMVPEAFVRRDAMWAEGDRDVYELNDLLQYLAMFTARPPIEAQPHSVLQFMHLRGWAQSDRVPEGTPTRPDADREVLIDIGTRLGVLK